MIVPALALFLSCLVTGTDGSVPFAGCTGLASWYGAAHQGKLTASGERFDMYKLTAAHRTIPLGAMVRVTNCDNGKSVVVRINDRGPNRRLKGRIIDLSFAAAKQLDMVKIGLVQIEIEILSAPQGGKRYEWSLFR